MDPVRAAISSRRFALTSRSSCTSPSPFLSLNIDMSNSTLSHAIPKSDRLESAF